jgi:hypothetical protein
VTPRRRGASAVAVLVAIAVGIAGCTETSGRSTTTTTRPFRQPAPRVLVVGDSNLFQSGADVDTALRSVGVEPTLHGLPGYGVKHFDRYWSREVPRLLETDPDVVVVGLGTNDALESADVLAFPDRLDQMMALFGDRPVIWITHVDERPAAPVDAGRTVNEMIRAAPDRWPNLTVLDFTLTMAEDPTILHRDGLHFSAGGRKVYAQEIARAAVDRLRRRSAQRSRLTSPSTRRWSPAVTAGSRLSAPPRASPPLVAWSRATSSAAGTAPSDVASAWASTRRAGSSGAPSRSRRGSLEPSA